MSYLHGVHLVSVVANDPGQLDLPDLVQLLHGEAAGPAAVLVPESVAEPEVVELLADQTGEGGADHGAGQGALGDAGGPQVNVVHVLVGRAVGIGSLKGTKRRY